MKSFEQGKMTEEKLSTKVGTQFPYDWSNPSMDEDVFISQVLNRGLTFDIVQTFNYFGAERIDSVLARKKVVVDESVLETLKKLKSGELVHVEKNVVHYFD